MGDELESGAYFDDSIQRFTVHNSVQERRTYGANWHWWNSVRVTLHVLGKQSDRERDEEIYRLVGVSVWRPSGRGKWNRDTVVILMFAEAHRFMDIGQAGVCESARQEEHVFLHYFWTWIIVGY